MLEIEYVTSWDEPVRLALYLGSYAIGSGQALCALDATDPDGDEYLEPWDTVSVNVPGDPVAAAWCATPGHLVVDSNNLSRELMGALVDGGVLRLTGECVRSGFCTYPLAEIQPAALSRLEGYEETVAALTGHGEAAENPSLSECAPTREGAVSPSRPEPTAPER